MTNPRYIRIGSTVHRIVDENERRSSFMPAVIAIMLLTVLALCLLHVGGALHESSGMCAESMERIDLLCGSNHKCYEAASSEFIRACKERQIEKVKQ